jgi:hypothetical protein
MGIGIAIEKSQSVVNLWKSSKVRFGSPASGIYPLIANEVGVHRARVFVASWGEGLPHSAKVGVEGSRS